MFAVRRLALLFLVCAALGCDTTGSGDAKPRASGDMEKSAAVEATSHVTGDFSPEPTARQPSSTPAAVDSADANDAASGDTKGQRVAPLPAWMAELSEWLRADLLGLHESGLLSIDPEDTVLHHFLERSYGFIAARDTQGPASDALRWAEWALARETSAYGYEDYSVSLNNLAGLYASQSRYADAEPLYQLALELRREVDGEGSVGFAQAQIALAAAYFSMGRILESHALYLDGLSMLRDKESNELDAHYEHYYRLFGWGVEQDSKGLICIDDPGTLEELRGKRGIAARLYIRVTGSNDGKIWGCGIYTDNSDLSTAAVHSGELEIGQTKVLAVTLLGPDRRFRGCLRNGIKSEPYGSWPDRFAFGDTSFVVVGNLDWEGRSQLEHDRFLHEFILSYIERNTPNYLQDSEYLRSARILVSAQLELGRVAEAETLLLRLVEGGHRSFGQSYSGYSNPLARLVRLYIEQDRYMEAEQLLMQALDVHQANPDPSPLERASILYHMAQIYYSKNEFDKARFCYMVAYSIQTTQNCITDSDYLINLLSMASLLTARGRCAEAERLLLDALENDRSELSPECISYASILTSIARAEICQDRWDEAEARLVAATNIARDSHFQDTQHAEMLGVLGEFYATQGRFHEAEPLLRESLEIYRMEVGDNTFPHIRARHKLASLFWSKGDSAETRLLFSQDIESRRVTLSRILIGLTESGRSGVYGQLAKPDTYASASVWLAEEGLDGASLGLDAALLFKGLLSEVSGQERSWGVAEGTAGWQEAHAAHRSLSGEAAALRGRLVEDPGNTELRERLAEAEAGVAEAERRLASESAVFARERRLATATWREVSAALGPGQALLEYVRYREVDPASGETGEARYVVYALRPPAPPVLVDLGPAEPVDAAVGRWRGEMEAAVAAYKGFAAPDATAEASLGEAAAALHGLLLAPVLSRAEIAAGTHLVVGPDGPLSFLPFEALVSGTGADGRPRYVVEDHPVSYVVSGREIAVWGMETEAAQSPALVLGNPDYALASVADEALGAHVAAALSRLDREGAGAPPAPGPGGAGPRMATAGGDDGACWPASGWEELPGFGTGVSAVAGALGAAGSAYLGPFTGGEALEELVKRTPGPEVLAIATHGYHCDTDAWARRLESAGVRRGLGAGFGEEAGVALPAEENPLLRSGLVLAGGNTLGSRAAGSGVEDGNLTALEVASLNLHGTRLVSLVACVTGLGDAASGSGVVGLRSAFRRAGAQTLQMSLFEVPLVSLAAAERERRAARGFLPPDGSAYVKHFFAGWRPGKAANGEQGGLSRVEAHHAAQRALLATARTPGHPDTGGVAHPLWWAAFALVGDPGE